MTNAIQPAHAPQSEHTPPDTELSAAQIMRLKTRTHVWRCPGCEHELRFKADQVEAIPFFIVRHLLRIHDIQPERIIAAEPALTGEVHAYCRQMSVRGRDA